MPQRTVLVEIDTHRPKYYILKLIDWASIIATSKCGVSIINTLKDLILL
jgi:hypothetical protein